jgi:flagellar biosynthesis anti-sigma factor FlgM
LKINSIPPSNMVENYKSKTQRSTPVQESGYLSDRVELSEGAKSFASVIQEVKSKLDERDEGEKKHLKDVSEQIANGTYRVDSSKVAEKILGGNFDAQA